MILLHLISPIDVAERALSRCVTTNEGSKNQVDDDTNRTLGEEEVHTTSRDFEVTLDYQFLEDFQDSCASDVEASTQGTRYNKTIGNLNFTSYCNLLFSNSDNSWRPKKFIKHNHTLHLMVSNSVVLFLHIFTLNLYFPGQT